MLKPVLLRLHRWITLLFALPLAVVIATGLLLSFQPILQTVSITPGVLTLEKAEALLHLEVHRRNYSEWEKQYNEVRTCFWFT